MLERETLTVDVCTTAAAVELDCAAGDELDCVGAAEDELDRETVVARELSTPGVSVEDPAGLDVTSTELDDKPMTEL